MRRCLTATPLAALLALAGAMVPPSIATGQSAPVAVLRGRVFASDSTPIRGARLSAVRSDSSTADTAVTGANGVFTLRLAPAREYLVRVTAIGFAAQQRSIFIARIAVPIVDFYAVRLPQRLATVQVTAAKRRRPARQENPATGVMSMQRPFADGFATIGLDRYDLNSLAASVPGVVNASTSDVAGFSLLGAPPGQNNVTLNGVEVQLDGLPRDLVMFSGVTGTAVDPSRGGFSGGQVFLRSSSADDLSRRGVHLSYRGFAPSGRQELDWAPGTVMRGEGLSGYASGPIVQGRLYYDLAVEGGRETLIGQGFDRWSRALSYRQVNPDSAAALIVAASALGIPTRFMAAPATTFYSTFVRAELNPDSTRAFSVTATGSGRTAPVLAGDLGVGARGTRRSASSNVIVDWSQYLHDGTVLNDARLAISSSTRRSAGAQTLPSVVVELRATPDSLPWAVPVVLNPALAASHRTSTLYQVLDDITWYAFANRHRFKGSIGTKIDWAVTGSASGAAASDVSTFTFSSLDDLRSSKPVRFTRTFGSDASKVSAVSPFASLGDQWQVTPRLIVQLGLRIDAGWIPTAIALDSVAQRTLGIATDRLPSYAAVSPRAGVWWRYGRRATVQGAAIEPRGQLRANIGRYVDALRPSVMEPVVRSSNRGDRLRGLYCSGDAAPVPEWSLIPRDPARIPSTCAGQPRLVTTAVPSISFLDRYRPASSWRSSVGWSINFATDSRIDFDGTLSLGMNGRAMVDENLRREASFVLAAEAGRPVFVDASAIDGSSGLVSLPASRRVPELAEVWRISSPRRSRAAALTTTFVPPSSASRQFSIAYTLAAGRTEANGFEATTAGDPRVVSYARSPFVSRHQVTVLFEQRVAHAIELTAFARAQSGLPFTPMVASDINGDGAFNDRAFIFTPTATDATVAAGMRQLLAERRAARCLSSQVGRVAGENSCEAAWSWHLAAGAHVQGGRLGLPRRTTLTIGIPDAIGLADAIAHSGKPVGWGRDLPIDSDLSRVEGFDPVARQFRYAINPRFGTPLTNGRASNSGAAVTLSLRVALGPDADKQILEQELSALASVPGEPDAARLRSRLGRTVPNVPAAIVRFKDSLSLSNDQVRALSAESRAFVARADSIWKPFAEFLAALRLDYATDEAVRRYRATKLAAYRNAATTAQTARLILTRRQVAELPLFLRRYFDEDYVMSFADRY